VARSVEEAQPVKDTPPVKAARLRRDAERNRLRILEVAGRVFAEQGLDASMNDIAAAAGVGVGTVYRRFPQRRDLIEALFVQRLDALERLASQAAAEPDPWKGLVWMFEQMMATEASDLSFAQLIDDDDARAAFIGGVDRIRPAGQLLIERAKAAGQLRADVEMSDFIVIKRMLTAATMTTRTVRPDLWRRMLVICLDGLRAPGATPLPGTALSDDEIRATIATPPGSAWRAVSSGVPSRPGGASRERDALTSEAARRVPRRR
jgi:AcrR family transcriptional regulator